MVKTHRKSSVVKTITNTANKALPVVDKSLKSVGKATKDVVETSIPVIEKGVSTVYDTMSSGLDLGVKSVKSVTKRATASGRRKSRKGGLKKRSLRKRTRKH